MSVPLVSITQVLGKCSVPLFLGKCFVSLVPRFQTDICYSANIISRALLGILGSKGDVVPHRDFFFGNGMLLAAPKKKVSHSKKRQKLYGPGKKQLKMVNCLNQCPSCGHYKRANTLCMHCFNEVRHIWKTRMGKEVEEPVQEQGLSELDRRILYPGRKETEYQKMLKDKDGYLERRMRTLPVSEKCKSMK